MAEPKEKTAGVLREPKPKHKLGLKVPTALRLPHDDLIKPTLPSQTSQTYQCLYSMTRGAIVPKRAVRISRPRLMKLAGIGARVTFDANVTHLCSIGLLQIRHIAGEHEGNEYTVLLPEERDTGSMPSLTTLTSQTSPAQKVDTLVRLETSQTRHSANVESIDTSGIPKTSFKTNTERSDDDEAFRQLFAAAKEITGRDVP